MIRALYVTVSFRQKKDSKNCLIFNFIGSKSKMQKLQVIPSQDQNNNASAALLVGYLGY
jgi:hypothetical protein